MPDFVDFIDLLMATFVLGLPMVGLSWFLFAQLYSSGDMDRTADRKAIKTRMKALKTSFKSKPKLKQGEKRQSNPVYDKWMWFGGGFYGLAALWTFVVIEISELFNFIVHNPGREALFGNGLVSLLVDLLINQFQNMISALVWFGYWNANSVLVWVLVAYAGYWIGVEMARREIRIPVTTLIQKVRALFTGQVS